MNYLHVVDQNDDPVAPNQNVTYTVNVTNNGPNAGTNAIFNMPSNGGSFTFQSMVTPATRQSPPSRRSETVSVALGLLAKVVRNFTTS